MMERAHTPLQTGLLAYASHTHDVKEWYYYPQPSQEVGTRAGPLTKDEIKRAFSKKEARSLCTHANWFLLFTCC